MTLQKPCGHRPEQPGAGTSRRYPPNHGRSSCLRPVNPEPGSRAPDILHAPGLEEASLRSSLSSRTRYSSAHHPCLQVSSDQSQPPLVVDSSGQPRHQHVVVDPVKEFPQIKIHDPLSQLSIPPAGFVRDVHPQVSAPCRAHKENGQPELPQSYRCTVNP